MHTLFQDLPYKIACIQLLTVNLVVNRKAYMTKFRMEYMSQFQMFSQFAFEIINGYHIYWS